MTSTRSPTFALPPFSPLILSWIFAGFGPPPPPPCARAIDGDRDGATVASIPAATLRSVFTPGIEAGRVDEAAGSRGDEQREGDRVVEHVDGDVRPQGVGALVNRGEDEAQDHELERRDPVRLAQMHGAEEQCGDRAGDPEGQAAA